MKSALDESKLKLNLFRFRRRESRWKAEPEVNAI